MRMLESDVYLG